MIIIKTKKPYQILSEGCKVRLVLDVDVTMQRKRTRKANGKKKEEASEVSFLYAAFVLYYWIVSVVLNCLSSSSSSCLQIM